MYKYTICTVQDAYPRVGILITKGFIRLENTPCAKLGLELIAGTSETISLSCHENAISIFENIHWSWSLQKKCCFWIIWQVSSGPTKAIIFLPKVLLTTIIHHTSDYHRKFWAVSIIWTTFECETNGVEQFKNIFRTMMNQTGGEWDGTSSNVFWRDCYNYEAKLVCRVLQQCCALELYDSAQLEFA